MQPKQDISISGKNENISENFGFYKNEKSLLEEQDIEKDHRNLIGKRLDIENYAFNSLSEYISQDKLFASELLLFLRDVRFSKQEFFIDISVSDIKYHHPAS